MPNLVQFLRSADPLASVACASGSKLFHVACDKDAMGFDVEPWPLDIPALPPDVRRAAAFILEPPGPYSADQHRARLALARLVRYAQSAPRRRFYLGVGFVETHSFDQKVCHIDVGRAFVRGGALARSSPPGRGTERLPPLVTWPNFDFWRTQTEHERRRAIADYYGCATHVDGSIGALLGSLRSLGLADTTAVVVQGDHGFSLGRHGRWSKYNLYEDATRVPLIIAVPGGSARVVDDVVESLDVMPTILELWGVKRVAAPTSQQPTLATAAVPPSTVAAPTTAADATTAGLPHYELGRRAVPLEGDSLLPYFLSPDGEPLPEPASSGTHHHHHHLAATPRRSTAARSELREWMLLHRPADAELPGAKPMRHIGRGAQLYLRTPSHSYTAYLRPACGCGQLLLLDEVLFDVHADPGEGSNLAYKPAHAGTRRALSSEVLARWQLGEGTVGLREASRSARQAMVGQLAGCFNSSARCHTPLGDL
jgi:hypothetical protein